MNFSAWTHLTLSHSTQLTHAEEYSQPHEDDVPVAEVGVLLDGLVQPGAVLEFDLRQK